MLDRDIIGNLITVSNEKNNAGNDYEFYGINKNKEFMPTVASTDNLDKNKYKIVKKNRFVFSGMQTGRDKCIRIALYDLDIPALVSPAYTTFDVTSEKILPEYLFMFFNSKEKDRYGAFLSDGSVRANLDWDVFCNIEIDIPPINIQRKFVDIYNGLKQKILILSSNIDDLKYICDINIDRFKKKYPKEELGNYIHRTDNKNTNNLIKKVYGVSTSKEFREPTSKVNKNELSSYKIVRPREISFVQTTHNEKVFANAINEFGEDIVVTSVNEVFYTDESKILPEYLVMFFSRKEFDRYARFNSWGSARETFTWNDLQEVKMSIPPIPEQKSIVRIFNNYKKRKKMINDLTEILNNICPILINGSLKEANNE